MKYILLSVFLGIIPESIYLSFFFIFAKQIKFKKRILFSLILASYSICSIFLAFSIWFHIVFIASIYLILLLLCKSQLIDVFLISNAYIVLTIITLICFLIPHYMTGVIFHNVFLFLFVLCFKNKLSLYYNKYCKLWNKNNNAIIKSITIRNISIILFNILLYVLNIIIITVYL